MSSMTSHSSQWAGYSQDVGFVRQRTPESPVEFGFVRQRTPEGPVEVAFARQQTPEGPLPQGQNTIYCVLPGQEHLHEHLQWNIEVRNTFFHFDTSSRLPLRKSRSDSDLLQQVILNLCIPKRAPDKPESIKKIPASFSKGVEELPSAGSATHIDGQKGACQPCIYHYKQKCKSGSKCTYCHLPHEIRKRPGKNSRRRTKEALDRLAGLEIGLDDDDLGRQVSAP